MEAIEASKKRRMDGEDDGRYGRYSPSSTSFTEELRFLLDPLRKEQLIDLLINLGSQHPSVADEIRQLASADPAHRKLFVRGLSWDTTSETLCAAFSVHGDIEEGAVIVDKATGKSRGYGFITYWNMESTKRALQEPTKLIDGRLAVCSLACEGLTGGSFTSDIAQRKLYIGGLSPETSNEIFISFFLRHGEIEEGSVAYDKDTNQSRGFGFVTYKTIDSARRAINDPNKMLGGKNLTVKLADSHKGKHQQQQSQTIVPFPLSVPAVYSQAGRHPAMSSTSPNYSAYSQAFASYSAAYSSMQQAHNPYQHFDARKYQ